MKKCKATLILSNFYLSFHSESSRNKGIIMSMQNCDGILHKNRLEVLKDDGVTIGCPSVLWLIGDRIIFVRLFADGDLKKRRHEKFDQDLKKKSNLPVEVFDVAQQMIDVFIEKIIRECQTKK